MADPASSLSGMPRCQLKITGRTWPDMASLRCIAAVKVEVKLISKDNAAEFAK